MNAESKKDARPEAVRATASERVLVVDDQEALRGAFARILTSAGYTVTQAANGGAALDALHGGSYDVVVSDVSMPGLGGIDLLRAIRKRELDVPVVLVTGNPTVESAMDAVEHGALRYLLKPVTSADLLQAVAHAMTLHRIARVKRESAAYLASVEKLAGERSTLQGNLRGALEGLWMAYQPIVDPKTRRIVAYEALVRTTEPTVPHPGALFSLGEHLQSVHEIGRAIRASVASTIASRDPACDVYVNLHPADLMDDALYAPDDPLARFAHRVVLEITERHALDESAGIAARAARLRKLGYRLAIDDLGAGYSGLTYFALLTPEVVKIDISLVRNVHLEPIKQKLVGSLVHLCKDLGMLVVAEGIEVAQERTALIDLGCDLLQGFLFARPGKPFPEVSW